MNLFEYLFIINKIFAFYFICIFLVLKYNLLNGEFTNLATVEELPNKIHIYKDNMYYLNFTYNYARIEAIVEKDEINNAVLNASYILSTIKYNKDIVKLMLEEDYFTNKTGKYNNYDNSSPSEKFKLEKEDSNEG